MLSRRYGDPHIDPILICLAIDLEMRNIGSCIVLVGGVRTCLVPGGTGRLATVLDPATYR
jgi:hypothetical protein